MSGDPRIQWCEDCFKEHAGECRRAPSVAVVSEKRREMPNPTEADLKDPLFEAIWSVTKKWDVNAPEFYSGYCGLNGSHVMVILNAIRKVT